MTIKNSIANLTDQQLVVKIYDERDTKNVRMLSDLYIELARRNLDLDTKSHIVGTIAMNYYSTLVFLNDVFKKNPVLKRTHQKKVIPYMINLKPPYCYSYLMMYADNWIDLTLKCIQKEPITFDKCLVFVNCGNDMNKKENILEIVKTIPKSWFKNPLLVNELIRYVNRSEHADLSKYIRDHLTKN